MEFLETLKAASLLWWVGIGTLVLLMFSPTRTLLSGLMGHVFSPAGRGIFLVIYQWLMWGMKKIIHAHRLYLRNLLLPRSVIYPTLEKNERRH